MAVAGWRVAFPLRAARLGTKPLKRPQRTRNQVCMNPRVGPGCCSFGQSLAQPALLPAGAGVSASRSESLPADLRFRECRLLSEVGRIGRMFRRRRRSPAPPRPLAPPGAFAEFHEFEGRWFVTDRWATGSGIAVERAATGDYLGRTVLSRIEAARGNRRPLVASIQEHSGNQRRAAAEWERFCTGVAGVPVWRYRPEKRLVILADETGMRCHDAWNSPPGWQRLPDGPPEAVGAALIAWMERLKPSWPTAASATIAYNGATILIYPVHGGWSGAPIARLPADAPPAAVGSDALAALDASGAASEIPSPQILEGFRAALRETGWTMGGLDAAPQVSIRRTTTGDLFISRINTAAEIPVAERGAEAVGNAVMAQLPVADTAPIPPDRQPTSFGPNTGWIAVRGVPAASVVEVLGLRDVRPAPWDGGIETAYEEGVFVGPPVDGWVLAAGSGILTTQMDPAELCRRLGSQVQLFRTHRVVEGHEWFLADGGELIRAVRYLGETGEFQQSGDPTQAERSLPIDGPDVVICEDDVFAIAGAWSLDPTTLHDHHSEAGPGTWGRLP